MRKRAKQMTREKTLVLVKPDGVMRGLTGQILTRFEQAGLKIIGLKMLRATRSQLDRHFPSSDNWLRIMGQRALDLSKEQGVDPIKLFKTSDPIEIGRQIKERNYVYYTNGPVIAIVFEGVNAIAAVRKLVGNTSPILANPGTIRGDFSTGSLNQANELCMACMNIIHASSSPDEAGQEVQCWFSDQELHPYQFLGPDRIFQLGQQPKK